PLPLAGLDPRERRREQPLDGPDPGAEGVHVGTQVASERRPPGLPHPAQLVERPGGGRPEEDRALALALLPLLARKDPGKAEEVTHAELVGDAGRLAQRAGAARVREPERHIGPDV